MDTGNCFFIKHEVFIFRLLPHMDNCCGIILSFAFYLQSGAFYLCLKCGLSYKIKADNVLRKAWLWCRSCRGVLWLTMDDVFAHAWVVKTHSTRVAKRSVLQGTQGSRSNMHCQHQSQAKTQLKFVHWENDRHIYCVWRRFKGLTQGYVTILSIQCICLHVLLVNVEVCILISGLARWQTGM